MTTKSTSFRLDNQTLGSIRYWAKTLNLSQADVIDMAVHKMGVAISLAQSLERGDAHPDSCKCSVCRFNKSACPCMKNSVARMSHKRWCPENNRVLRVTAATAGEFNIGMKVFDGKRKIATIERKE